MFKHILVPTDGSAVAKKAIDAAVQFAKETGAKITGYYALPGQPYSYSSDGEVDEAVREQYAKLVREEAEDAVDVIRLEAKQAGVPCTSIITLAPTPYQGIVEAAQASRCDVIFMASNGRSGLPEQMLGSVTHKVLQLSKTPVLVYR
jgi:nucleotide-binding universal stress UspA family protein